MNLSYKIKKKNLTPIPVAVRSKAWICGIPLAGFAGSNLAGAWILVSCKCCVLYRQRPLRKGRFLVQSNLTKWVCVHARACVCHSV